MSFKPHFVIYGVGAVGGTYGAQLLSQRNDKDLGYKVSFIARNETLKTLNSNGIKALAKRNAELEQEFVARSVNACSSIDQLKLDSDETLVILLCVKSKDTQACAKTIKDFTEAKSIEGFIVVSVQNGVENEEILAAELSAKHVIAAYTNILAETIEPGIYEREGDYWLCLGELKANRENGFADHPRIDQIIKVFDQADLVVKKSNKIEVDLWQKLVWNSSYNPLSVFYEANLKALYDNPEARERVINIMRETKELALLQGIEVDPEIDKKHFERSSVPSWHNFKTSMLQDYLKKRPIELEQLLGVVVRLAEENNHLVPYAKELYQDLQEKLAV